MLLTVTPVDHERQLHVLDQSRIIGKQSGSLFVYVRIIIEQLYQ